MYCRTLGCLFTAIPASDCPADGYLAVQVDRAGNSTELGHFDTEEEAEACAAAERERLLEANSQFGVGA
jgi:hypothetical protein